MAIAFSTITNSIAALTIASASDHTNVLIRDLDEIPEAVEPRDCPILFPDPANFITDFLPTRRSFGGGGEAKFDITYNMNYIFLYAPIGTGRGLFDVIPNMVTDIASILDAIIENDAITGVVDIGPIGIAEFGPVVDPSDVEFFGTTLTFQITEFKN